MLKKLISSENQWVCRRVVRPSNALMGPEIEAAACGQEEGGLGRQAASHFSIPLRLV